MELLKIDNKVPVIDLIDICLNKGLADGFDHQFRYVGQWWQFGDCDHNVADVFSLEDFCPMFWSWRYGAVIQNRGIHFAGKNGGHADAVFPFIFAGAGAQCGHGEFAGVIGYPAQRCGTLAAG